MERAEQSGGRAASPAAALEINGAVVRLVMGDITKAQVDAIVNAANESLLGGGGVDGAIHRAGGPAILEECKKLGGCRPGEAKLTTGGRLPARYVIHAVGPRYYEDPAAAPAVLASAYRSALTLAEQHGVATLACPSISTGAFGYPVGEASRVALRTVVDYLRDHSRPSPTLREVRFVLFDRHTFDAYAAALEQLR